MDRIRGVILLAVGTAAAVLAFAVVAARTVEQGEVALAEAQLDFILSDTAEIIERNLQLGLPLGELQQVPPLLEEVQGASPDIVAADVFSPAGVTVFSTDRGAVGEPVPPAWLRAIGESRSAGARWTADEGTTVTLGAPLVNDFGQFEGWVAIIVERDALSAPLSRVPGAVLAALPFAGLAALLAAGAGWLVLPRLDRPLARAQTALTERATAAGMPDGTPLEETVCLAIVRTRQAERAVAAAQDEMARLDAQV